MHAAKQTCPFFFFPSINFVHHCHSVGEHCFRLCIRMCMCQVLLRIGTFSLVCVATIVPIATTPFWYESQVRNSCELKINVFFLCAAEKVFHWLTCLPTVHSVDFSSHRSDALDILSTDEVSLFSRSFLCVFDAKNGFSICLNSSVVVGARHA